MHRPVEINNKSSLVEQRRDILKGDRREKKSGYPRPAPLETIEEIRAYLDQPDDIDCLLCGRRLKTLSTHLAKIHRISTDDYKSMYGLPYGRGLTCAQVTQKLHAHGLGIVANKSTDAMQRFIDSKPANGRTSGLKSLVALQVLQTINTLPPKPRSYGPRDAPYGRGDVESIVAGAESGAMLNDLLSKARGMAHSTFHKLLAEHPDLKQRYAAVAGLARRQQLRSNNPLDGKRKRGADCPKSKLNEASVREIRRLLAADTSCAEIARAFGTSWSSIDAIRKGKSWAWLH